MFCGLSCVLINDPTSRARYPNNHKCLNTVIRYDATLGENGIIVCDHEVGHHATIVASAVVTSDIKTHALMADVPTKQMFN